MNASEDYGDLFVDVPDLFPSRTCPAVQDAASLESEAESDIRPCAFLDDHDISQLAAVSHAHFASIEIDFANRMYMQAEKPLVDPFLLCRPDSRQLAS